MTLNHSPKAMAPRLTVDLTACILMMTPLVSMAEGGKPRLLMPSAPAPLF